LCTLGACLLALPAAAAAGTPQDTALRRAVEALPRQAGGPPGVIAVVQRGAQRRVFTAGVANAVTRAPIRLGDRWRIASATKAVTGAAALRLVQQGRLSLDDTIARRLPSLPAAWGRVTLAQLMQHTSGLPDYAESEQLRQYAITGRPAEPATLVGFVSDRPLRFAPGSRYEYSNTDNIVVAMFIEAVTGLSFERVLDQLVLDPLSMRYTSLPLGIRIQAPYVHGYTFQGARREDATEGLDMSLVWASGGIISAPLDLTTFIRAYAGTRLFSGATRARQRTFVPGASDPPGPGVNSAGLSIFRYRTRCGTVYGHTGNINGYTAFIAATPDGRRSAVVQASTNLSVGTGNQRAFAALRATFELAACAALR
jgi:D-alanyl-D-alanine carboxypeptidase